MGTHFRGIGHMHKQCASGTPPVFCTLDTRLKNMFEYFQSSNQVDLA